MKLVKVYDEHGHVAGYAQLPSEGGSVQPEPARLSTFVVEGTYNGETIVLAPTESIPDVATLKTLVNDGVIGRMRLSRGGVGSICINEPLEDGGDAYVSYIGVVDAGILDVRIVDASE